MKEITCPSETSVHAKLLAGPLPQIPFPLAGVGTFPYIIPNPKSSDPPLVAVCWWGLVLCLMHWMGTLVLFAVQMRGFGATARTT